MSSSHRSTIEKHITVIKYHLTETCIVFFHFFFTSVENPSTKMATRRLKRT